MVIDPISIERLLLLHPKIRKPAILAFIEASMALTDREGMVVMMRVDNTLRTFPAQDALYAQGRTKPGKIVTNAKAGQSYHNYGLALDFFLLVNGKAVWDIKSDFDKDLIADWMEVVRIFKNHGFEWGGDWEFVDNPHFQMVFGLSWKVLLERHNAGKVDAGYKYVTI